MLTPEQFARILVDDLETSLGTQLEKQVAQAIRAQCQAFAGAIVEDDVESGHVREEGEPMDGIEDLRIVIKVCFDSLILLLFTYGHPLTLTH